MTDTVKTSASNPNYQITWRPIRPDFSIERVKSAGSGCYSETTYEVVSRHELDAEDFARLDVCGLLGIGQAYSVRKHETFEDIVPPVTVDKRTDKVVADVLPWNEYTREPYTMTHNYEYHRYEVVRICDSGD